MILDRRQIPLGRGHGRSPPLLRLACTVVYAIARARTGRAAVR